MPPERSPKGKEALNSVDGKIAAEPLPSKDSVIDHVEGGHLEVVDHLLFDLGMEITGADCAEHVFQPGVLLGAGDDERGVSHPKSGMTSLLGICGWTAPVLGDELHHVIAGLGEVVRVHRSQQEIGFDCVVESIDQCNEPRGSTGCVEDRLFHRYTLRAIVTYVSVRLSSLQALSLT